MKSLITFCLFFSVILVRAQTPVSPSAGATTVVATTVVATTVVAPSAEGKAVLDVEKQRFAAQVSKNYDVLNKVLANDLIYTHSNGNVDTKQSYIQSLRDGKLTYEAIESQEQNVRVYGNTAIINGICVSKSVSNGQASTSRLRYTDVYMRQGNQWQMVTWQSLKITQ